MDEVHLHASEQEQPKQTSSHLSRILPLVFGGLFLFSIGVFVGYYFANTSKDVVTKDPEQLSQVSPTQEPIPPTPISVSAIPAGWSEFLSTACNVVLPVPPKQAPYYTTDSNTVDYGHYWMIREHEDKNDTLLPHTTSVAFDNPNSSGSDYVAGLVSVSCGPNKANFTTNTFTDAYIKDYMDGSSPSEIYLAKQEKVNLWGRDVVEIAFKGESILYGTPKYLYATEKQVYLISESSNSSKQLTQETTKTIFNNLQFKD